MTWPARCLLALLLIAGPASAATFTEDFESFDLTGFNPELKPDQEWYNYREGSDIGEVSNQPPIIAGSQSFHINGDITTDASNRRADFELEIPTQLTSTTFFIKGTPFADDNTGSRQVVRIQSSAPVRTMVEFYVFCDDATNTTGCEFRVRWQRVDTTGQVLINATLGQTQFKVQVVPDWKTAEFRLFVDDVDDGVFPFMEVPKNIGRLRFEQDRADVPLALAFDDWTVDGAVEGTTDTVSGDVANGIKNFLTNIRFTTTGSKFFFGILLFVVLSAAVIAPLLALGKDNTVIPGTGFYLLLVTLWLILMEIWPDWVGIGLIVLVAALIATIVRRLVLGIRDAGTAPGLVAGALGYFIIATTLLAFSGYATDEIQLPTGQPEEESESGNETTTQQSFGGAVAECTLKFVTLGSKGDCSRKTVSKEWKTFTNAASSIFNWARTGLDFLFQLLTFQLPIPVLFNVMIVLPPAAALATVAMMIIRG